MKKSFKNISDNGIIKAFNISLFYNPNVILKPCDKYGNTDLPSFKNYPSIYCSQGKIITFPDGKLLSTIENVSGYYKIVKKENI